MMKLKYLGGCAAAACIMIASAINAALAADVLATPAVDSPLAQRALVNGLAAAGARLVAVGQRGHILYSDDHGASWRQARVPVSADLTAVHFPTPQMGWAVGHDGVVLHSADSGATWALQLDGRRAAQALAARQLAAHGPDEPFLDVWFEDARRGYAVGAFGLLFCTTDSGKSWEPALQLADNPRGLHLNAIRPAGGALYIAGEQGLLLRMPAGGERFAAVATPYQGSFFGVLGTPQSVLAFGLRGNAFRSADGGRSWQKIDTGVPAGLTAGAVMPDGHLVLVSQGGHVLSSADGGATFARVDATPGHAASVAADGKGGLVIGGARGLRLQAIDN